MSGHEPFLYAQEVGIQSPNERSNASYYKRLYTFDLFIMEQRRPDKETDCYQYHAAQIWFFLFEDMKSSNFKQTDFSLADVKKMNLTLDQCLKLSGCKGKAQDFSFWIRSQSMSSAVQMLTDEGIIGTYKLYCAKDPIIQIIIRHAEDLSPNTSRAPSHATSLASRQQKSARRGLLAPELFIQPKVRHVSGSTDMETFEEIQDDQQVISIVKEGQTFTFTQDYLKGWIESEIANLKPLTDIVVQSLGPDGVTRDVRLDASDTFVRSQAKREELLTDLYSHVPNFQKSCLEFIYDIRSFGQNDKTKKRLESIGDQFYLGSPYFDTKIRDKLLQLPVQAGMLQQALDALSNKRLGSTICASHDLSPIYEYALGITWDKTMKKAVITPLKSSHSSLAFRAKELLKKGGSAFRKK
ncbi:hypothetical protein FAGAP_7141 [Fusarium agapanthi]|uniref:Uncharacterized protein n=1 Tax=Fusarium agapanthi TaxID=1803897 RepID=A0A9P5EBD9_9HYPO|nr:hypothetical protein FAGAP_7141 [Fusarium agapanthi]